MLRPFERGVPLENRHRRLSRELAERLVTKRVGDAECRYAALSLAKQIAHAAQSKVFPGDLESVLGMNEHLQPFGDLRTHVAEQDAVRLLRPAPNATAQLVKLREPEALGM